jgi:hypothetical protein
VVRDEQMMPMIEARRKVIKRLHGRVEAMLLWVRLIHSSSLPNGLRGMSMAAPRQVAPSNTWFNDPRRTLLGRRQRSPASKPDRRCHG